MVIAGIGAARTSGANIRSKDSRSCCWCASVERCSESRCRRSRRRSTPTAEGKSRDNRLVRSLASDSDCASRTLQSQRGIFYNTKSWGISQPALLLSIGPLVTAYAPPVTVRCGRATCQNQVICRSRVQKELASEISAGRPRQRCYSWGWYKELMWTVYNMLHSDGQGVWALQWSHDRAPLAWCTHRSHYL